MSGRLSSEDGDTFSAAKLIFLGEMQSSHCGDVSQVMASLLTAQSRSNFGLYQKRQMVMGNETFGRPARESPHGLA